MSILAWIVVGIIAGWLAERITGRNHGLLTNLLVGIVGAFLGGFIFSSLLGFRYEEGFNLPSIARSRQPRRRSTLQWCGLVSKDYACPPRVGCH